MLAEAPAAERAIDAGALAACLDTLTAASGDDSAVRGSLEQARLALARARALRTGDAAARALRIARAALLFADRTLALEQARRASREAPR